MQRWIAWMVVGVLLLGIGGGALLWHHRQNRLDKVWVPLPLGAETTETARVNLAKQLDIELRKPAVLLAVASDLHLAEKFKLPSHEAAAAELGKRLFIELGQTDTMLGKTSTLNVGVNGKTGEHILLSQITERLMKDVQRAYEAKGSPAPSF
jgi:hypothetical protein